MLKNRTIPFGYCMVNGKYAINIDEANAITEIFKQYLSGKSLKSIAENMTVPYISGKPSWNKNMVCRVIENVHYLGDDRFPKIISQEDFLMAQRIKKSRCTYKKSEQITHPASELSPITAKTSYRPTEQIQRLTGEINRLLDAQSDSEEIRKLIYKCAELKYNAISEVKQ